MKAFSVFGAGLRSEIDFPELASHDGAQESWTLHRADRCELPQQNRLLGVIPNLPCRVELHAADGGGFILSHSCTGSFSVQGRGGSRIAFAAHAEAPADLVRADVLGRVLALSMHTLGILSLHASAAALAQGAIAFLAPKGYGKSTLALSLTRAGAKFVTDDVMPVQTGHPITVTPGVQSVRLPNDSAVRLIDDDVKTRRGVDGKQVVDRLPADIVTSGPVPLVALYALSPTRIEAPLVSRSRLNSREAVLALLRHAKIAALLGGSEAPKVFQQAARIAAAVPVYRLNIARDLQRLPDVASVIACWHGGISAQHR